MAGLAPLSLFALLVAGAKHIALDPDGAGPASTSPGHELLFGLMALLMLALYALVAAQRLAGRQHRLGEELRQAHASQDRTPCKDALTGLPNRLGLETLLRNAGANAERSGARVSLLFIGLDGFKSINDS